MPTPPKFDVFLSHNCRDKPAVRELKQQLAAQRLRAWYDEDELRPGVPWQQLLETGIKSSASVAVLVGKDGLGPWEDEEMQGALRLAVRDKRPVIPVLLPGAPIQPELALFLGNRTWVDLRGGFTDGGIAKLVWGITGQKPSQPGPTLSPGLTPLGPNKPEPRPLHGDLDGPFGSKQKLEDGTNIAVGTPFRAEPGTRVLPWYDPAKSKASPNWKEKLTALRARFEQIIDECRPVECTMIQTRVPAYAANRSIDPPAYAGQLPSGGGLSRRASRLFAPDGRPLTGLFAIRSDKGEPMCDAKEQPLAVRFGLSRLFLLCPSSRHLHDPRPAPAPRLIELARDGTSLLYELPAEVAVSIWRNWLSGFSRHENSNEYLWLDALFELSWQRQPGSLLHSKRFAQVANTSFGLVGGGLFPRLPDGLLQPAATPIPHEHGYPTACYSKLSDVARASVAAINEFLEHETATVDKKPKEVSGNNGAPQGSGQPVHDFSTYCEGDTEPTLNKRIHTLIDCEKDYIVYLDEDLCVEYSWTESYGETPAGFGEIANKIGQLEALSMAVLGQQQMEGFRRLLAEAMARIVGDKSIRKARSALRAAESYLQASTAETSNRPPRLKRTRMKKCKILFLAANPKRTTQLALDEESREIDQKIRAADYRDALELVTKWAVRPDDLLQYLNQHRPHVVHFSGHGSPTEEIILQDANRKPKSVSKAALKQLFMTLKDNIRVVVLNACYSRPQAEAIVEIIDCAVGMKRAIGDKAAIAFAASFYRAIGFGRSVQEAFDQGKTALLLEGIPEEDTPELLVRKGVDPETILLARSCNSTPNRTHPSVTSGATRVRHGSTSSRQASRQAVTPSRAQPRRPVNSVGVVPYDGFHKAFREVVAALRIQETGAVLHVVFGSIADVREIPVVIPVGQEFDFWQRGPRSVLAFFESIRVGERDFFDEVEKRWPVSERPRAAGLGHAKYIELPRNSQSLPGVLFVVTTRNLSQDSKHYGLYVNTPIEGIDYILDGVIAAANSNHLESIAVPLLGAGYANIRRTLHSEKMERLMKQAVALLTIQKLERALADESSTLRRGVIVVYSRKPQGQEEHELWQSITRFLAGHSAQRESLLSEALKAANNQETSLTENATKEDSALGPTRPHAASAPGKEKKSGGLGLWEEKLEYLQQQEAIVADPAQKFALKKQIEEARVKIRELGS